MHDVRPIADHEIESIIIDMVAEIKTDAEDDPSMLDRRNTATWVYANVLVEGVYLFEGAWYTLSNDQWLDDTFTKAMKEAIERTTNETIDY